MEGILVAGPRDLGMRHHGQCSLHSGLVVWRLLLALASLNLQFVTCHDLQPLPVYYVNTKVRVERSALIIKSLRRYGYSDITRIEAFTRKDFGKNETMSDFHPLMHVKGFELMILSIARVSTSGITLTRGPYRTPGIVSLRVLSS